MLRIYIRTYVRGTSFFLVFFISCVCVCVCFFFRLWQTFAQRAYRDCLEAARGMLASPDVAYLLSFSVVSSILVIVSPLPPRPRCLDLCRNLRVVFVLCCVMCFFLYSFTSGSCFLVWFGFTFTCFLFCFLFSCVTINANPGVTIYY